MKTVQWCHCEWVGFDGLWSGCKLDVSIVESTVEEGFRGQMLARRVSRSDTFQTYIMLDSMSGWYCCALTIILPAEVLDASDVIVKEVSICT